MLPSHRQSDCQTVGQSGWIFGQYGVLSSSKYLSRNHSVIATPVRERQSFNSSLRQVMMSIGGSSSANHRPVHPVIGLGSSGRPDQGRSIFLTRCRTTTTTNKKKKKRRNHNSRLALEELIPRSHGLTLCDPTLVTPHFIAPPTFPDLV